MIMIELYQAATKKSWSIKELMRIYSNSTEKNIFK